MFLWDMMRKMNQAADYITRDSQQNVSSHDNDYDEEDVEDDLFLEELREIRMGFKSLYDSGIIIIDPSKGRYSARSDSAPGVTYDIEYHSDGSSMIARCTCPAGKKEMLCKHVKRVIAFTELK